ncbi:MAG TPA: DUF1835 domain-containing protein, partial [Rhizomicrobium sp.]|nr:DUF1835 domain-containing protein [Rhizomicrobium sp.]
MTSSSNFSRDRDALHICFTLSGGGILRQTLRNAGLSPVVITLSDDLSVGPIDPPDARLRKLWYERELDGEFPGWVEEEAREFWSIASEDWKRRVVWFSRRSAAEYCGFLGWLERIGSTSFDLLDVTNELHEVSTRGGRKSVVLESIAMVNPEQLDLK